MAITSKIFGERGRRRAQALGIDPARLPPGQSPSEKWPVLSLGATPRIERAQWVLSVDGAVANPYVLDFEHLLAEEQTDWTGDIHCVTRWSKFGMHWRGVSVRMLLERAEPLAEATHLMAHCYGGYTTNMPLSDVLDHPAFIAHEVDGAPLAPDHGGPARLLVPHLYLWKSAKWIKRLEVLTEDRLGFWEVNGYHHRGDPWREERHSVDEYVARAMRRAARSSPDRPGLTQPVRSGRQAAVKMRSRLPILPLMSVSTAPPTADASGYPVGLIPPTRRGRSKNMIGDIIVELGFATREQVDEAVRQSRAAGKTTGQWLIESGALRPDQLARALAERFGVDFIDLSSYEVDMGAVNLVPGESCKRYQAVPVGFMATGELLLATADPTNVMTVDEISMITGKRVYTAVAAIEDIVALIGRLNRLGDSVEIEEVGEEETAPLLPEVADSEAPVVKLVHQIIAEAVQRGASDIHCDPENGDMRVFFRIDGVLVPAATVAKAMAPGLISRIKIMASLDISEKRLPQDGRLALGLEGRRVDVRVVTLPLVKGEGVVMRILDAGATVRDLEALGMQDHERERFRVAINKPYGAVLVTGPTGSGKSTTLYGALTEVNDGERSILTIEDPVESQIHGVKQMQVANKAGMTFAKGLRAMLRADPDVIMVGEIRDRETAEIAIQAALTGHLVLSTLHTRDAPSAITRLLDMGVEPFMVAAAIDCVVAQRLARRLCDHCKQPATLPEAALDRYDLRGAEIFDPVGCIRCANSGYRGRVGLYEVMPIDEEIRALLLSGASVDDIASTAVRSGMRRMRDDGLHKVRSGLTTLAEIGRVTSGF